MIPTSTVAVQNRVGSRAVLHGRRVHAHKIMQNRGIRLKEIMGIAQLKLAMKTTIMKTAVSIRILYFLLAPKPLSVRVIVHCEGLMMGLLECQSGPASVVGSGGGGPVVADCVCELRAHGVVHVGPLAVDGHLGLLDVFQPLGGTAYRQCAALQYGFDVVSAHVEVGHCV
ncbi:hypothetical protein PanWU01x14_162250 [Parasponia andersonii]|uniref:Uncharacterized protein n=1 Tax=Parasponia andersonii TaxID=3476 RepID=A0A2P5CDG7_PARAD|nr:hypothetical protein PanWU01x14_162250 [Parasponia andersonii]